MPWFSHDRTIPTDDGSAALDRESAIRRQLIAGLVKIGLATRQHAWAGGEQRGLTPTQGQVLAILLQRAPHGARVTELATALGVSQATTSVALKALTEKGLIQRTTPEDDGRAVVLTLTDAGLEEARQTLSWTDFLIDSVDELDEAEQAAFQRSIVKMIRAMQLKGQIPVSRMCATCTWFRPNAHPGSDHPHHCAYVDAPFGDRQLRLECSDFKAAAPELAERNWEEFVGVG
ncbi:MAG: MarR family transcriptional regulator [Thermomicrobiales bacterium]|nr:MarR family transcriptional regulator [Thermomicrobiales bacterium]